MNSTDLLPQVDGWAKVVIAVLVAIGGALFSSTGFFKELFAYRTRVREIAALTPKPIDTIKGSDIAQWQAVTDLTAAVKENTASVAALAAVISAETQQATEERKSRLEKTLEEVIHVLEERDRERERKAPRSRS